MRGGEGEGPGKPACTWMLGVTKVEFYSGRSGRNDGNLFGIRVNCCH